jgi:small-conductance mechanosensitive channel
MVESSSERKTNIGIFWLLLGMVAVAVIVVGLLLKFMPMKSEMLSQLEGIFKIGLGILVVLSAANILNKIITSRLRQLAELTGAEFDKTRFSIAQNLVSAIIYLIAIVIIMRIVPGLEEVAFSLLAGAGIAAIVLGFAAKDVASNLIAGIFIAIFQPFRVGDRILFNDTYGTVEDITLRHTIIKTWKNQRLVVPNSKISQSTIINYSLKDEKCVETVEIPISYEADIDKAKKIMIEEVEKHPEFIEIRASSELLGKKEPVKVRVISIGESAIILRLYFWAKDKPTGFRMSCELREAIKKRFDKEGIEIPYPHRTIVYKGKKGSAWC